MIAFMIAAVALAFLFAVAYYWHFYGADGQPFTDDATPPEEVVREFGSRMKNVSLLAPAADVARAMDREYGAYVAEETLTRWKEDPASAPGRLTSSPWPERIDISTSTPTDTGYRVEGVVVEVTSDVMESGGDARGYPVTVFLEREDDGWKIVDVVRDTSVDIPPASLTGTYSCLPHRGSGPHTMECAFGIRLDDGVHYALDFSAYSSLTGMTIATGERIRVEGELTPLSMIPEGERIRIYDIQGVMRVSSIVQL